MAGLHRYPAARRLGSSEGQDITPQKQRARAEAAVALSEEKYRTLFEIMDQGFGIAEIIVDAAGHPTDYRMLEINRQFELLTGQKRAVFLDGRTVREDPAKLLTTLRSGLSPLQSTQG